MGNTVYVIGLIVALTFTIFNIDDIIWDIVCIVNKRKINMRSKRIPLEKLDSQPLKLLAIVIAALHEENVLQQVVDNLIKMTQYPSSMYHIFIGVYPNDEPTMAVTEMLGQKYKNVHAVVNVLPGPTSKARQIMRAIAINNIYGIKSVIFSCLIPPFMPIRLIWGNIINLSATLHAWQWYILGVAKGKKRTKRRWNKTDHEFLDKNVLHRYYRNIGDVLLEKQYINPGTLEEMLTLSHKENKRLGVILLENNVVTEEQLMIAVAASQNKLFVKNISLFKSDIVESFDKSLLTQLLFYPLLKLNDGFVVAKTNFTPHYAFKNFIDDGYNIYTVYTTKDRVLEAIGTIDNESINTINDSVIELLSQGKITWEQAILAIDNQSYIPNIIGYMGIGSALSESIQ